MPRLDVRSRFAVDPAHNASVSLLEGIEQGAIITDQFSKSSVNGRIYQNNRNFFTFLPSRPLGTTYQLAIHQKSSNEKVKYKPKIFAKKPVFARVCN